MGTKGRAIVGMNVDKLVEALNRAYASEWLAYYQYWLGAKLIKGPMKDAVAAELTIHATEELGHAMLLADRIIQLGGTPVVHPRDWMSASPCAYDAPVDPLVSTRTRSPGTWRSRSCSRRSSTRKIYRACGRTSTSCWEDPHDPPTRQMTLFVLVRGARGR
jgi:hypothetical protein